MGSSAAKEAWATAQPPTAADSPAGWQEEPGSPLPLLGSPRDNTAVFAHRSCVRN